jgi:hypothetical protein
MAEARPVTDDWVERDIMVLLQLLSGAPSSRKWAIGCAAGARSVQPGFGSERRFLLCLHRGRERGLGALTGSGRQTGYSRSMSESAGLVNGCGLYIKGWLKSAMIWGQNPPVHRMRT